MTRYLERAEHTCRLLAEQMALLEDREVEEIDQYWRRLFRSTGFAAVGTHNIESFNDEDFMLTDSYTLTDILTFDAANQSSIVSSVSAARENARQVRNVIGRQLWRKLNTAYLDMQTMSMTRVWNSDPVSFFLNLEDAIRTLSSIMHSTMYRDHGWNFLRLGRYVERLQIVVSLLSAQVEIFPASEAHSDPDWSSLLSACDSQLAYNRKHSPLAYQPQKVYAFLICDVALSHSVCFSLRQIVGNLHTVSQGRAEAKIVSIDDHTCQIERDIGRDWQSAYPDEAELRDVLRGVQAESLKLNDAIAKAYFDYQLDRRVTQ